MKNEWSMNEQWNNEWFVEKRFEQLTFTLAHDFGGSVSQSLLPTMINQQETDSQVSTFDYNPKKSWDFSLLENNHMG